MDTQASAHTPVFHDGDPVTQAAHVPLRWALRAQTNDMHQRLHRHAGFAAIQNGTIDRTAYRDLIARLYGFYASFDAAAAGTDRSQWLMADLTALGMAPPFDALPQCPHIPHLHTPHRRLGALYVAEGSALGGRDLARGLDRLFGKDTTEGRRFFIGRGAGTGEAWANTLAQLEAASREPAARADIIDAAVATFASFERWLSGWRISLHG